MNCKTREPLISLCLILLASQSVMAQPGLSIKQCNLEAKTDMESAYCEVYEKAGSRGLPNFFNSDKIRRKCKRFC